MTEPVNPVIVEMTWEDFRHTISGHNLIVLPGGMTAIHRADRCDLCLSQQEDSPCVACGESLHSRIEECEEWGI